MNDNKKYSFGEAVKFFMLTIICVMLAIQAVSLSFVKTDLSRLSLDFDSFADRIENSIMYEEAGEDDSGEKEIAESILAGVGFDVTENKNKNLDLIVDIVPKTVTEETIVFVKLWDKTYETKKTEMNRFTVSIDTETDEIMDVTGYEVEIIIKNGDTVETELRMIPQITY